MTFCMCFNRISKSEEHIHLVSAYSWKRIMVVGYGLEYSNELKLPSDNALSLLFV